MTTRPRFIVCEDGSEYLERFTRFLGDDFAFVPALDLWFVTRWNDVVAAAEDPVRFPASLPTSPLDRTLGGSNVLTVDGAQQQRMRAPMEATLRPRLVEQRAAAIVQCLETSV